MSCLAVHSHSHSVGLKIVLPRFYNTNRAGNIISFDVWKQCYEESRGVKKSQRLQCKSQFHSQALHNFSAGFRLAEARMRRSEFRHSSCSADPPCSSEMQRCDHSLPCVRGWAEGLLKPHNHTVSVLQTCLSLSHKGNGGIAAWFRLGIHGIRHDVIVI